MAAALVSSQRLPDISEPMSVSLPGSVVPSSSLRYNGQPGSGQVQNGTMAERNGIQSEAADSDRDSVAPDGQRRGRARNLQDWNQIPKVKDLTGEKVCEDFLAFLESYREAEEPSAAQHTSSQPRSARAALKFVYRDQLRALREYGLNTLYVDFGHLLRTEVALSGAIRGQYYRFLPYLRRAIALFVRKYEPSYLYLTAPGTMLTSSSSSAAVRDFQLALYNLNLLSPIRHLKTDKVGTLSSFSGTVTRTSEVRPELIAGTFICEECKTHIADIEQQFKYTEPTMCPNATCQNRIAWRLDISASRFADWQKVRVQENASEIPTGSMPRTLDVILRGEMVERAKAGDRMTFTGSLVVVPDVGQIAAPGGSAESVRSQSGPEGRRGREGMSDGVTGLKALGARDMTYRMAFLACHAMASDVRSNSTDVRGEADLLDGEEDQDTFLRSLSQAEIDDLRSMVQSDAIYARLVNSIAPTVYGHEMVKKGVLLQLMGGVHKQTPEGIHLRGDINICIVGDPSTSKSQFLKYVCGFLPRAVYTSGKASSAAGLTAAVVKDEETGEFTIEAGALMLADNGICAIDEFDKMDITDQVAIHEAMEQQTISIAKAGIQATLNARTSVLAAANPVGGRYNRKLTLRSNIAMSAPIMSRFDLFFVVLDECNEKVDRHIADHIVNVHRFRDAAIQPEFTTEQLQRYIRYARTFHPKLTPEASVVLVEKYRDLRQDDSTGLGKSSYRITVRQLESMIRLSEAIARANCTDEITPAFVNEAYHLLSQSIIRVEKDDVQLDENEYETTAEADAADLAALAAAETMAGIARGDLPSEDASAAPSARAKTVLSYDSYMAMANLIVLKLDSVEQESGSGMVKSELIQWYLEQKESEIESEEELNKTEDLLRKVLKKLVKDQILLLLQGDGLQTLRDAMSDGQSAESGQMQTSSADDEAIYMVHPSQDIDAWTGTSTTA